MRAALAAVTGGSHQAHHLVGLNCSRDADANESENAGHVPVGQARSPRRMSPRDQRDGRSQHEQQRANRRQHVIFGQRLGQHRRDRNRRRECPDEDDLGAAC